MKNVWMAMLLGGVVSALSAADLAASQPNGRLVFEDGFANGFDRWKAFDAATWRVTEGGIAEITARQNAYEPPHRSPYHVALVKDLKVGAGRIEFRVRSPENTGPHRDCCVFFGWQDPAHFYYAHLGAKPDPHSGQVMLVNGADRVALTTNENPVPWTDDWHTVCLEHDPTTGRIAVYFDDLENPLMEVTDKTLAGGRVGIGSFDDRNAFDDVRVWSLDGE